MRFLGLLTAILLFLSLVAPAVAGQDHASSVFGERVAGVFRDDIGDDDGDDDGDSDDDDSSAGEDPWVFARYFVIDPTLDPGSVEAGAALERLDWQSDDPAFPGDPPGSLRAIYDASLPAGWFGFALPAPVAAYDTYSAAAAFVIRSEGFSADPNGFFQISWGLWNSQTTGLDRTGSFTSFATDTYELIEFDWFPNVSPFFGGPFVAPSAFGAEVGGDAFGNFTSLFGLQVALPLDVPLLAVLEHRPDVHALVATVYRIVDSGRVVPVDGAVGVASLDFLTLREYEIDTIGLTLWQDGFSGPTPSVTATLDFHALTATSGLVRPESMLSPGDQDDDDDSDDD
jgi:hypothetical protein